MSDSHITKRTLAAAMKELMAEKPMAKISVGEIVGRCGLNRKSFYYHFRDKYDLVNWIFYTEVFSEIQKANPPNMLEVFERICTYLYENRDFYRNALKVTGQNSFSDYFIEVIQPVFLIYFESVFENGKTKNSFRYILPTPPEGRSPAGCLRIQKSPRTNSSTS